MLKKIIKLVAVSAIVSVGLSPNNSYAMQATNLESLKKQAGEIVFDLTLNQASQTETYNKLLEGIRTSYHIDTTDIKLIHIAAILGLTPMLEIFVKMGASIKEKAIDGNRAIHYAAYMGHFDTFEWLLKHGAKIHDKNRYGKKPLHFAAEGGKIEMVKLLLKEGAKIHDTDNAGTEPLHFAALNGHIEMVKWLLENGADINDTNDNGTKPIHFAAKGGHIPMVEWLVKNGAKINDTNNSGTKLIHFAAEGGHIAMVKWLVKNGADINDTNKKGQKPLHFAAKSGQIEMVKWLLENGAKSNDTDNYDFKAIHHAITHENMELIQLVIEHGSVIDETAVDEADNIEDIASRNSIKNYLIIMASFLARNNEVFTNFVKEQLSSSKQKEVRAENLQKLITWASYRNRKFVDRLYQKIIDLFDENDRKAFGFTYTNPKELYLAVATSAPNTNFIKTLFDICKGNIFKSQPGSFEWKLTDIIEKELKKVDRDRIKLLDYYKKNYNFKQNLAGMIIPNYIKNSQNPVMPQVTVSQDSTTNKNLVDIVIKTTKPKNTGLFSKAFNGQ